MAAQAYAAAGFRPAVAEAGEIVHKPG